MEPVVEMSTINAISQFLGQEFYGASVKAFEDIKFDVRNVILRLLPRIEAYVTRYVGDLEKVVHQTCCHSVQ